MPAMADTQARLRRSSSGSSCRPRSNHSWATDALGGDQAATSAGGPLKSGGQPHRCGVVGREVDPAHPPVLDDVAQDVGQLQGDAEVVGQGRRPPGRCAPKMASDSRPTEPATAGSTPPGRRWCA